METSQFATFKPIISSIDKNKEDIARYYTENNITPPNEYLSRYLEGVINDSKFKPISSSQPFTPTESVKNSSKLTIKLNDEEISKQKSSVKFSENMSTLDKGKQVINFFVNKGLTKEQAAGIAGNFFMESSFNTEILGDNNTSFGIAQWHGPRWEKLKQFAKAKGASEKDLHTQLEYAWEELQTTERKALDKLITAKSARESANIFSHMFERPKFYNKEREVKAEEFYNA